MVELPDSEKTGVKAAVAALHDPADPVPGSAAHVEQLDMLPLSQIGDLSETETEVPARQGAGRPPGSRNKNTAAWRDFILSRYPSPLVALAETYSRSVGDLAKALGLNCPPNYAQAVELFKLQLQAAKELAPYVHSKQPQAVELGDGGLMQLIINTGGATSEQVSEAGELDINFLDAEIVGNQGLKDEEKGDSVASDSVATENSEVNQEHE